MNDASAFWAVEWEPSYGISITQARRLTGEEKKGFADWFGGIGAFGIDGTRVDCPLLAHDDLPKRDPDCQFCGCSNTSWEISEAEKNRLLALNQARHEDADLAEKKECYGEQEKTESAESERQRAVSLVDSWEISERTVQDEGGSTTEYLHTIRIGPETLSFVERNNFDAGRVISPDYAVSAGLGKGGLCNEHDGSYWWFDLSADGRWVPVRELTKSEKICYAIIGKYGKTAGHGIRM